MPFQLLSRRDQRQLPFQGRSLSCNPDQISTVNFNLPEGIEYLDRNLESLRQVIGQARKLGTTASQKNLLDRSLTLFSSSAIEVHGLANFQSKDVRYGFDDWLNRSRLDTVRQSFRASHLLPVRKSVPIPSAANSCTGCRQLKRRAQTPNECR